MNLFKLTLFFLIFSLIDAKACMCMEGINTKYAYKNADVVVYARVIESIIGIDSSEKNDERTTIRLLGNIFKAVVIRQFKGTSTTDTITIISGPHSCETWLHSGKEYIIYATADKEKNYQTGMCSGNKLYSKKQHKLLLKLSRKYNQ